MSVRTSLARLAAAAALLVAAASASAVPLPGAPSADALARHPALREWAEDRRAVPPDTPHEVLLWLRHTPEALRALQETADAVSDVRGPRYGQYLTPAQLGDVMRPPARRLAAVDAWLRASGASRVRVEGAAGDLVRATMTVRAAERAFGVRLRRFVRRRGGGRVLLRSLEPPAVPREVADAVEVIHNLHGLPHGRRRRRRREALASHASPRAAAARVAARDAASNAPVTLAVSQPLPQLNVTFVPVCADGSLTTARPPCAGPRALVGVTLRADAVNPVAGFTREVQVDAVECAPTPGNASVVLCTASLDARAARAWLPYYETARVRVTQRYADGSASAAGEVPFPVLATPFVTPQTVRDAYNVPRSARVVNASAASVLVAEFEDDFFQRRNVAQFLSAFGFDPAAADAIHVVGPNPAGQDSGEGELDLQMVASLAPGSNLTFWEVRANSTTDHLDDILLFCHQWLNATSPPLVASVSYGMSTPSVRAFFGDAYLARSYVEIQKVAALGHTMIIASGDSGAGDLGEPVTNWPSCERLNPDWPSSSPYVTSVGATMFTPGDRPACAASVDCSRDPVGEIAVSMEQGSYWTTGGGFSDSTARPAYQDAAVASFLAAAGAAGQLPPASVWSRGGRAYPDVSLAGHAVAMVQDGAMTVADGTSCAAPLLAAMVMYWNELRASQGRPPMGLLNPWLYDAAARRPAAFNDVVVGSNRCGSYGEFTYPYDPMNVTQCCDAAFHATAGFDAVSGLGSINFPELLALV